MESKIWNKKIPLSSFLLSSENQTKILHKSHKLIVEQSGFFNLGMVIGQGERKPRIESSTTPFKKWLYFSSCTSQRGCVNTYITHTHTHTYTYTSNTYPSHMHICSKHRYTQIYITHTANIHIYSTCRYIHIYITHTHKHTQIHMHIHRTHMQRCIYIYIYIYIYI